MDSRWILVIIVTVIVSSNVIVAYSDLLLSNAGNQRAYFSPIGKFPLMGTGKISTVLENLEERYESGGWLSHAVQGLDQSSLLLPSLSSGVMNITLPNGKYNLLQCIPRIRTGAFLPLKNGFYFATGVSESDSSPLTRIVNPTGECFSCNANFSEPVDSCVSLENTTTVVCISAKKIYWVSVNESNCTNFGLLSFPFMQDCFTQEGPENARLQLDRLASDPFLPKFYVVCSNQAVNVLAYSYSTENNFTLTWQRSVAEPHTLLSLPNMVLVQSMTSTKTIGKIFALNSISGDISWTFTQNLPENIDMNEMTWAAGTFISPSVSRVYLFYNSMIENAQEVAAIDTEDGTSKWTVQVRDSQIAPLLVTPCDVSICPPNSLTVLIPTRRGLEVAVDTMNAKTMISWNILGNEVQWFMLLGDGIHWAQLTKTAGGRDEPQKFDLDIYGCSPHGHGIFCNICDKGYFYSNHRCVECPAVPVLLVVLVFLAFLIVSLIFGILSKLGIGVVPLVQLVTFYQFLSIELNLAVGWPHSLLDFFAFLDVLDFSLDRFGLQCQFDVSYITRYTWSMAGPLVVLGLLGVIIGGIFLFDKCKLISTARRESIVGLILRGLGTILRTLYLPLTVKAARSLNCLEIAPGKFVLSDDPSIECYSGDWYGMVPWSVIGFLVFTLLPIVLLLSAHMYYESLGSLGKILDDVYISVTNGLRPGARFYEVVNMFTKVSVPLMAIVFYLPSAAAMGMGIFLVNTLLFPLAFLPFIRSDHNILQCVCMTVNCVMAFLASLGNPDSASFDQPLGQVILIITLIPLALGVVVTAIDIRTYFREKKGFKKKIPTRPVWQRSTIKEAIIAHQPEELQIGMWYRQPWLAIVFCPLSLLSIAGFIMLFSVSAVPKGASQWSAAQYIGSSPTYVLSATMIVYYYLRTYLRAPNMVVGNRFARWSGAILMTISIVAVARRGEYPHLSTTDLLLPLLHSYL